MLIGKNPESLTWERRGKLYQPKGEEMIAKRLGALGVETATVVNGYLYSKLPALREGYKRSFNTWPSSDPRYWENRSGPTTSALAIAFLDKHNRAQLKRGKGAKRAKRTP